MKLVKLGATLDRGQTCLTMPMQRSGKKPPPADRVMGKYEEAMEGMEPLPRLNKKVISVSSLNDIEEEKEFWRSKGALERLNAIEFQRRMVYGTDRVTSRLQRLLETSEISQD